jgi:hypothetical protein
MISQDEYLSVIRRILSPPTFPRVVWPRASHRAKHISPEDPRADIFETTGGEVIVNTRFSTVFARHGVEGARFEHPLVQRKAADPERIFKALTWASTISVNGYPETLNAKLRHYLPPSFSIATIA